MLSKLGLSPLVSKKSISDDLRLLQNSSAFGNRLMALRLGNRRNQSVMVKHVVSRVREVPIEGPILESLTIIPGDVKDR